jgi:two-component system, OmpR family, response regulator ChvI
MRKLQTKEKNDMNATFEVNSSPTLEKTTNTEKPQYRILYVDDDLDILFSIKMGLEAYGFMVDTFSNPLEALSFYKPELYDLVLVDIKMPEMSGVEFHQELRKKAVYGTEIKTCFITAFEKYFETLTEGFPELYEGCFIQKPIQIKDLVNKINQELKPKS